jgi:hypothetical protein
MHALQRCQGTCIMSLSTLRAGCGVCRAEVQHARVSETLYRKRIGPGAIPRAAPFLRPLVIYAVRRYPDLRAGKYWAGKYNAVLNIHINCHAVEGGVDYRRTLYLCSQEPPRQVWPLLYSTLQI